MKKLLSTLVLTVTTIGGVFAIPPSVTVEHSVDLSTSQQLGRRESSKLQESVNSSFILGAEGFAPLEEKGDSSPHLKKRVRSSDDLVADDDSDEEKDEKEARISRQNSQEKLSDALPQEQKLPEQKLQGFWSTKFGSALVSIKKAIVNSFYGIKTYLFG